MKNGKIMLQDVFLDTEYVKKRMAERKEIKNKEFGYKVYTSNKKTKSVYVVLYFQGAKGLYYKTSTLRISDHIAKTPHRQFIVTPGKVASSKLRAQFNSHLDHFFKRSKLKSAVITLKSVSRYIEKIDNEKNNKTLDKN